MPSPSTTVVSATTTATTTSSMTTTTTKATTTTTTATPRPTPLPTTKPTPRTEPTPAPPAGDCKGEPCALASQCRSRWGYCGTSPAHCNEKSTWRAGGCG